MHARRRRPSWSIRILFALAILVIGYASFYMQTQTVTNPWTGEDQRIHKQMSTEAEIQMGLAALPEIKKMHGGDFPDPGLQNLVDQVGAKLLATKFVGDTPYNFEFHLLDDRTTINAFALPGGQIFITYGLYKRLPDEAALAGVLGHEIGHVLARHAAEQMATAMKNASIAQATGVVAGADSNNPQVAAMVNHMLNTRYGREDEYQSDEIGVRILIDAGYNPEGLLEVMKVLSEAAQGSNPPEFLSTHPNPGNRLERIQQLIAEYQK